MRFITLILLSLTTLFSSTLYLTIGSNPSRLNPLIATDSASQTITDYLFNGLVKYDTDLGIVGDLAKGYEKLSATKLRFYLRKNVRWHDGREFTAEDVLFTYETIMSDKVSTPYSEDFRQVKRVTVVDPYTVEVEYSQPYFKMLEIWMMSIIPKHLLENEKNLMTSSFNQNPIGTGPFVLSKLELSKEITLKANPDYFEHPPKLEKIIYSVVPDPSTEFYMLQKGQIDLSALDAMKWAKKIGADFNKSYDIYTEVAKAYTYLGFNLERKKFSPKVRKAIAMAIDRQEIVDILFFGKGQVCYGPFLPGTVAYNNQYEKTTPNPQQAVKLLKEEGYDSNNPFSFEVITNTANSTRLAAAQIIQHQLKKIGVEMKLRVMEWQAFLTTIVFPKEFDAVLLGWGLSIVPDAYSIWHSAAIKPGGFNVNSYRNNEVDALIEKAEGIVNKELFGKVYQEIFSKIVEDNPYVFLYIPHSITAVKRSVKPIEPSIIGLKHNIIEWMKE